MSMSSVYSDADRESNKESIVLEDTLVSYRIWKPKIKNKLFGKDVLDMVERDEEEEKKEAEQLKDEKLKLYLSERKKSIAKARSIIFSSLNKDLVPLFEDETEYPLLRPDLLWQGIIKHFESQTIVNQFHLRQQLNEIKLKVKENEKIDSYISRLLQLTRELKAADSSFKATDRELLFYILNGLPKSFKQIKLILENDSATNVNTAVLKLKQFQEQEIINLNKESTKINSNSGKKSEEEDGVTYLNQQNNRNNFRNNFSSNSNNRFDINKNRKNTNNNNSTNRPGFRKCFTCDSSNHVAWNCPENKDAVKCENCRYIGGHTTEQCRKPKRNWNNNNNNNINSNKNYSKNGTTLLNVSEQKKSSTNTHRCCSDSENELSSDDETGYHCMNVVDLSKYNYTTKNDEIKVGLDSASSINTCNNKKFLFDLKPSKPYQAKDASGNVTTYDQAGTLKIISLIDNNKKLIEINNVYYAPYCPLNLLSVAHISDNGKYVFFDQDEASIIRKKDSHITMKFNKINNIYVNNFKALINKENSKPIMKQEKEINCKLQLVNAATATVIKNNSAESQSNNISEMKGNHDTSSEQDSNLVASENQPPSTLPSINPKLLRYHHRFAHIGFQGLKAIMNSKFITGVDPIKISDSIRILSHSSSNILCHGCAVGKSHRKPFHSADHSPKPALQILDRVYADIIGPFNVLGLHNEKYVLVLLDEKSGKGWNFSLQHKSEVPQLIINWSKQIQNETKKKLIEFHSDNGTEFVNSTLKEYFISEGILSTTTTTYTPQHNPVERYNRTIEDGSKSMLAHGNITTRFWPEAIETAVYIRNHCISRKNDAMPPNSIWLKDIYLIKNKEQRDLCIDDRHFQCDAKHLRTFGCNVYVHTPDALRKKLDKNSEQGIFIGYSQHKAGYYKILVLNSKKVIRSRDVLFNEDQFSFIQDFNSFNYNNNNNNNNTMFKNKESKADTSSDDSESEDEIKSHRDENDNDRVSDHEFGIEAESDDELKIDADNNIESNPPTSPSESESESDSSPFLASASARPTSSIPSHFTRSRSHLASAYNSSDDAAMMAILETERIEQDIDDDIDIPKTYRQAINGNQRKLWLTAIDKEKKSFIEKEVFELVTRPKNVNIVKSKWVFALKPNNGSSSLSSPSRYIYKARLVARGYTQLYGVDFFDTFSPVMKLKSFRNVLALATILDYEIKHLDVPTAFLNAELKEDIFMEQPEGFSNGDKNYVWKLKKSLYGTKQAGLNWNINFDKTLRSTGLHRLKSDNCVYVKQSRTGNFIIVLIWVDDAIPCYHISDESEWLEIKLVLEKKYNIKEITDDVHILGMRIIRDRQNRTLKLDQLDYIRKMLKEFNMNNSRPNQTPTSSYKLSKKDCPTNIVDNTQGVNNNNNNKNNSNNNNNNRVQEIRFYQQLVGSLNYASICTRPDTTYAVHTVSLFMTNPGEKHLSACKTLLRYYQGTAELGLTYNANYSINTNQQLLMPRNPSQFHFIIDAYSDSDWAGDLDNRHSTTGYIIKLNGNTISWRTKKQNKVALSSCEAEYYAMASCIQELIWMRQFLHELLKYDPRYHKDCININLYVDNQSAIQLSKNDMHHDRSKHIELRYHFIREEIKFNNIHVTYIDTANQLADILTKGLSKIIFNKLRERIMDAVIK